MSGRFVEIAGNAILGIDTLWGGDVMCASGTGRFIADSWFSDEPLPEAYTNPLAARVRESGGVSAKTPDAKLIEEYLNGKFGSPDSIGPYRASLFYTCDRYAASFRMGDSVPDTTVCNTLAVSEAPDPAPPIDKVTLPSEPLGSGPPLLVTSAPMITPDEVSENTIDAWVMPVERFGSNGDGMIAATGAVG